MSDPPVATMLSTDEGELEFQRYFVAAALRTTRALDRSFAAPSSSAGAGRNRGHR